MYDLKDDPVIRALERTGTLTEEEAICPVCGEECDTAFYDRDGEVIGCDCCLHRGDPWKDPRFLRKPIFVW